MLKQASAVTGLVLVGLTGLLGNDAMEHVVLLSASGERPLQTPSAGGNTPTAPLCPRATLPDENVCVPVPTADEGAIDNDSAEVNSAEVNSAEVDSAKGTAAPPRTSTAASTNE